jgi:hypothetical protein
VSLQLSKKDCAAIHTALEHFVNVLEQWETENEEPYEYLMHFRYLMMTFHAAQQTGGGSLVACDTDGQCATGSPQENALFSGSFQSH